MPVSQKPCAWCAKPFDAPRDRPTKIYCCDTCAHNAKTSRARARAKAREENPQGDGEASSPTCCNWCSKVVEKPAPGQTHCNDTCQKAARAARDRARRAERTAAVERDGKKCGECGRRHFSENGCPRCRERSRREGVAEKQLVRQLAERAKQGSVCSQCEHGEPLSGAIDGWACKLWRALTCQPHKIGGATLFAARLETGT